MPPPPDAPPPPAPDKRAPDASQQSLAFADALLADGDFYRAITEYKRALFLAPDGPDADRARLAIGTAYVRGGQADAAIAHYAGLQQTFSGTPLATRAQLETGYARLMGGEFDAATTALTAWLAQHGGASPDDASRAAYLLGWSHLEAGHDADAETAFEKTPPFAGRASLLDAVRGMKSVPTKSPALAGLLSVVPGLGHVYLGQPFIAVAAFLWNGLFAFGVVDAVRHQDWGLAAVLGMFEVLWYSGTIFGAVSGAHKYNRDARLFALEAMKRQFDAKPEAWPPGVQAP